MVSEFRKQKYYWLFVTFLDNDHNGKVDMRDVEILTEKMCQNKPYNKKDMMDEWWKMLNGMLEYIGVERRDVMYYDEWVAVWIKFAENPEELDWFINYRHHVFEYYKDDEYNAITAESQYRGFSPFGVDREEAKLAFKKAMPNKSSISEEELVSLWEAYYTSDDPNTPGNYVCGKFYF